MAGNNVDKVADTPCSVPRSIQMDMDTTGFVDKSSSSTQASCDPLKNSNVLIIV